MLWVLTASTVHSTGKGKYKDLYAMGPDRQHFTLLAVHGRSLAPQQPSNTGLSCLVFSHLHPRVDLTVDHPSPLSYVFRCFLCFFLVISVHSSNAVKPCSLWVFLYSCFLVHFIDWRLSSDWYALPHDVAKNIQFPGALFTKGNWWSVIRWSYNGCATSHCYSRNISYVRSS